MSASVLIVLTMVAPLAGGADFPQWRGPQRDGHVAGLAPRTSWPASLKPGWKVPVGLGHASPILAGGRAYVFTREGEEEVVRALDAATGRLVWRQSYAAPYTVNPAAAGHGPGPKSTPVLADGRLYTFGISGVLSAWDAATGRLVWRKEGGPSPGYGTAQSPVVDQGQLIAHVGTDGNGALTAFDAATGAVRWAWKQDGPAYASPVVGVLAGTRQVVAQTQGNLVGLAADTGVLLWKVPFTTSYEQNAVTPILDGDRVIYGGLDHPVKALRVTRQGAALTTAEEWQNADVSTYMSTPVLVAGRLYGLSRRNKGQYFALDAATGKTLWLSPARQGDNAALLAGGGTLFLLDTDAELAVLPLGAPSFAPVRTWTVAESATWAHPVVTSGGVLVKDVDTLAFWRFE
jgi:outer membrane protein assembly factor BamB